MSIDDFLKSNAPIYLLGIAIFTTTVIVGLLFLIFQLLDRQRKIAQKQRAEFSILREYLENQLENANSATSENYELWSDANRLYVEGQRGLVGNTKYGEDFLARLGIRVQELTDRGSLVAVLMPFQRHHNPIYDAIKRACERMQYRAERSDIPFRPGNFLQQAVLLIVQSRFVICDISTRNPNVMYELGIAHALNKRVLIISKLIDTISDKDIGEMQFAPSNLATEQIIFYKDTYDLENRLRDAIRSFAAQVAIRQ